MRNAKWLGSLCATVMLCVGTGLAQAAPENGWWWNPNESGRGFSIEIQGDTLFMAGYLYENDGRASWMASSGPMQNATSYQGRFLAFSNGQTLAGPYQAPAAATDAGAVSLQLNGRQVGSMGIPKTWPTHGTTAGLNCGRDAGAPVSFTYESPFCFTGRNLRVSVQLDMDSGADAGAAYATVLQEQ